MKTNWTKNELVAYILLYTANSDYSESKEEKKIILSKVDQDTFEKIHKEFDGDNDYQSLQKIISGLEEQNYSKSDLSLLFSDIKTLFLSDGDYGILEKNMFMYLKKVLS